MVVKNKILFVLVLLLTAFVSDAQLTNPLLKAGADPWVFQKDGYYYYTHTTARKIVLWKTRKMEDLEYAEKKVVFTPPPNTAYSDGTWAPEIHYLNGKWYIYFAADSTDNIQHRMFVLENDAEDPMKGEFKMKGKVLTQGDKWSIDGTVYEQNGKLFFLWSGWEGDVNGRQNIYISAMKDPWTLEGERVLLSTPEFPWETNGRLKSNAAKEVFVNEGPQMLRNGNHLFLIYSASGCWTDFYALGMLSTDTAANLLDPKSWRKSDRPVFQGNPGAGVFATGHNSFFTSPDGKESWILYHANDAPGQGCGGHRSPRAQPFTWKADGSPEFGQPISTTVSLPSPGGASKVKIKKKD